MTDTIVPAFTTRTLGVIGGSSLFHATAFSSGLTARTVSTEFGDVVVHEGPWRHEQQPAGTPQLQIAFIQRHHADPDGAYRQPRQINFRAIAAALKQLQCAAVIGVYSVGSMTQRLQVGRLVVPDDYFNPFDILNLSHHYDAHVVPEVSAHLRAALLAELDGGEFAAHDGGVYVQTAGPRFETKAEVRFFAQFGELLGMTGANEAELMNELRVPFAMFGIVDNMGNGLGEKLTLEEFKVAQKQNAERMEGAVLRVLDGFARRDVLGGLQ